MKNVFILLIWLVAYAARVSEKVSFKIFTDFWCVLLKKHINQIATLFSLHGRRRRRKENLSRVNPSVEE